MAPSVLLDNRTIGRSGEWHYRAPMVIWNSVERRTEWLFILALFTPQSRRCFLASRHPRLDDAFSRPGILVSTMRSRVPASPSRRGFPRLDDAFRRIDDALRASLVLNSRTSDDPPSRRGRCVHVNDLLNFVPSPEIISLPENRLRFGEHFLFVPVSLKVLLPIYHLKRGGNYSVRSVVQ